jgi:flagellar biogenesis protein FliO
MGLNERSLTRRHSILILKIKEKLLVLNCHKMDIKFIWTPTHMGIVLNEIADASSKDSIREGEDAQYLIPVTYLKLLEDQSESSSRRMVHRIRKTKEKYVVL